MSADPGEHVLPKLPRDTQGPVFAEPWQAQAFAMAVHLHEQGHFTWQQWAATLAEQIESAGPNDMTEYYEHWLATLETVTANAGLASETELDSQRQAWKRAAEATPHGQPIVLGRDQHQH